MPYVAIGRWAYISGITGEGEILGSIEPQPKRVVANCSQTVSPMLPPGEYKRGVGCTAIPPFAKLLWSML